MRISRISITDWMPFRGTQQLELPPGPVAVVAQWEDNLDRSNWAGKSALLEAVEWCLFGVHRKRFEDGVIHRGAPATRVVVTFDDGTEVKRQRRRGKSTELVVVRAGETLRKKQAQEEVDVLLGLDRDDYRTVLYFAQGDIEGLVSKTSGQRRETVASWLDLDAWGRVSSRLRALSRAASTDLEVERRDREHAVGVLNDLCHSMGAEGPADPAAALQRARDLVEHARASVRAATDLREEVDKLLDAATDAAALESDINMREELRQKICVARDEVQAHDSEFDSDLVKAERTYEDSTTALNLASTEQAEALRVCRGDFDGRCPVIDSECPASDYVRACGAASRTRLEKARRAREEAARRHQEASSLVHAMRRSERDRMAARARYNALVEQHRALTRRIDAAPKPVEADVAELREQRSAAAEQQHEAERAFHRAANLLESVEEWSSTVDSASAQVEGAQLKAAAADLAARCAGPTGVPAEVASASIDELQDRANDLLSGTGLSVVFAWDRAAADLEAACPECGYRYVGQRDKECPSCSTTRGQRRVEELDVLVDDGSGEVEDVRAKSGGARVLVASAIRLAASAVLRESRGSSAAFAVVDEPFGPLDAENGQALAQVFCGMLDQVGLEQAIVVSHDRALLSALPHRIEIVRRQTWSEAKVTQ